jgi:hypothetical protein
MSRQISDQSQPFVWSDIQKHVITSPKVRRKVIKQYEKKFLTRHSKQQKAKPKKKTSKQLESGDLGRLSFREYIITKSKKLQVERKDYEQKYLSRCMKNLNAKPKRSSRKKLDHDLISGRLNLSEHVEKKRKELQSGLNQYEKKYLVRYNKSKIKMNKSKSLSESDEDLGRFSIRKHTVTKREELQAERNAYEKEYLARYLKQQKTKLKIAALEQKLRLTKIELEEPKPSIKQKRREYEKEYITRYNKQQKANPKKKVFAIR